MKHAARLIDDEPEPVDLLRDYRGQAAGFAVLAAGDGMSSLSALSANVALVVRDR